MRRLDIAPATITFGDALRFEVAVRLNGLDPKDVVVEMLLGLYTKRENIRDSNHYSFEATGTMTDSGEHVFALEVQPEQCGKLEYRIRVYPFHEMLTHPFEMGMMRWL